jgi:hypothetical protein
VYVQELKAREAALPPSKRTSDAILQNMILDKYVKFSGGKKHGRIQGLGSTSSFIQRTPAGYVDTSSDSYDSTASMATYRPQSVETMEQMYERLRANVQQDIANMRESVKEELRAEFLANQSVQQDQDVEEAEEEEEYRPNVAFNQSSSEIDPTFFTGIHNEFQELLGRDFQIPGLQIDNIQGQNFQGNGNYHGGGNFQGNGLMQSGANFQIGQNAQGGRNEFPLSGGRNQSMMNNPRGGRTNAGSGSGRGGRTSSGSGGRTSAGSGSARTSVESARGRGRRGSA